MTWVRSSGAADDIDAAKGAEDGRAVRGMDRGGDIGIRSSGPSSNSRSSSSGNGGSSNDSTGGGPADERVARLPKGEARRLQSWYMPETFSSRSRGGNQSRAEQLASGSSHTLLLAWYVRETKLIRRKVSEAATMASC